MAQQAGNDTLWFLYESDGTLVGFTYNGTAYYYTKNVQGDVTGIVDVNVNLVVEYTYDPWGKLLSTTGNLADTVGAVNPFLYRSYYYDSEIGLYYLNDRYYDPITCRMLNANSMVGVGTRVSSYNMFAYCDNNPISRSDSSGQWFGLDDLIASAVGAVAGVAAQFVSDALVSAASGEWKFSNWQTYAGAAVGGAIGGVVTLYAGPIVGAATAAGASTLIGQTLENVTSGGTKRSVGAILLNTGTDTVIGAAAGKFLPVKVPGITTGRNSMAAVFSSGITKIRNGAASRMSVKVVGKGITSSLISDSGATSFSALISYLKDAYESYEQEVKSSVPSGPMYWTQG